MNGSVAPIQVTTLVYVLHEDRLLLLERQKEPNLGLWSPPGGKLEPGESPIRGALRELEEETGLTASTARLVAIVTERDEVRDDSWLMFVVRAEVTTDRPLLSGDEGRLVWVPLSELGDVDTPAADPYISSIVREDRPGVALMEATFCDGKLRDVSIKHG